MTKWYRMNADLGCMYEITEKEAKRKLRSRYWIRFYDSYWQKFTDMWQDIRDPFRSIIFKSEVNEDDS